MNIQKMLKQAQAMQEKITATQSAIEALRFEGVAGNGLVKITLTGKGEATAVAVDASLLQPSEKEMVEDLLLVAINDARRQADSATVNAMSGITAGLPLPPGFKLPV